MNKQILRLAIPNVISNISVPLLSIVDTKLMGELYEPAYLGAVAIGAIIFNFLYWSMGFLRMGTTGITAQAFGRNDAKVIILTLAQALLVAVVAGLAILLLQYPIEQACFYLISASQEVEDLARTYYGIRVWAAPATIAVFAFNGWFLGMQNAKYLMFITLVINGVNIILSWLFVVHFGMEVVGVAWSTVIAQYMGLMAAIGLFFKKYQAYIPYFEQQLLFQLKVFKQFFDVNKDIFIRTICLLFTFTFFTMESAKGGDVVLAANKLLLEYLMLMSYATDGFAFAAESLTGKYFGAKNKPLLLKSIRYAFYWGAVFAGFTTLVYALAGTQLIVLFTDNTAIIAAASDYIWWIVWLPIVSIGAYIWDGVYVGLTASVAMRNTMVVATLVFYLPVYYWLVPYYGNHALWMALFSFMLARTVLQTVLAPKYVYRLLD